MKRAFCAALLLISFSGGAFAQSTQATGVPVTGEVVNRSTLNSSVTVTTGNTFQQALASNITGAKERQALTVQNNNTSTDNCWVFLGTTASATKATSILLGPGQAYTRYWPFVPSDAVQVTCASNSDTVYVDNQ
jgi:hypothetical protein